MTSQFGFFCTRKINQNATCMKLPSVINAALCQGASRGVPVSQAYTTIFFCPSHQPSPVTFVPRCVPLHPCQSPFRSFCDLQVSDQHQDLWGPPDHHVVLWPERCHCIQVSLLTRAEPPLSACSLQRPSPNAAMILASFHRLFEVFFW